MTNAEIREDAGISPQTVMRALGMTKHQLSVWERGKFPPTCEPGYRWIRFLAGLERHALAGAEIAATERQGAA